MGSRIFKFVVGPNEKELNVHEAAISALSEPLSVLLTGPFKEARDLRVNWPDVDESTFVRFLEWAYARDYGVATPKPALDPAGETRNNPCTYLSGTKRLLYSLNSLFSPPDSDSAAMLRDCCRNPKCSQSLQNVHYRLEMVICIRCRRKYACQICSGNIPGRHYNNCGSAFNDCPRPSCAGSRYLSLGICHNESCDRYQERDRRTITSDVSCPFCKCDFMSPQCRGCSSVLWECPRCPFEASNGNSKRRAMVSTFMNEAGTIYPALDPICELSVNNEASEDYTDVFLCHAKLYVLGDLYDIPALRQLSFHRLYATLKDFILYSDRMNDVATLARYLFENTRAEDKIRDMITLYYACIIEDVYNYGSVKSLIDDLPDFAHSLIVKMSGRLS